MKISKDRLNQIIREEVESALVDEGFFQKAKEKIGKGFEKLAAKNRERLAKKKEKAGPKQKTGSGLSLSGPKKKKRPPKFDAEGQRIREEDIGEEEITEGEAEGEEKGGIKQ
jgi:hypothetical protein